MNTIPFYIRAIFLLVFSLSFGKAAQLTLLTHDSFELPKALLEGFERNNNVQVNVLKAGDAGQMLNKLILTQGSIADVVYGIDTTLFNKAKTAGILRVETFKWIATGYVNLNYDKAMKGPLPKRLEDLTSPAYRNMLVVENPATSSPGLSFLLSTLHHFGPQKAWEFWAKLRDNGLKVTQGWSQAYYTEFSRNGGHYPLVVSYASSPAAEVFFSKQKLTQSPTGNLFFVGGVFRQSEGMAVTASSKNVALGKAFIQFMQSEKVQKQIPTSMWMYPIMPNISLPDVYRFAQKPVAFYAPEPTDPLLTQVDALIQKWNAVVIERQNP
ncbi:MAG: thiamine ABC transporter substrate-binding protein [Deinococcaceae bacterium]